MWIRPSGDGFVVPCHVSLSDVLVEQPGGLRLLGVRTETDVALKLAELAGDEPISYSRVQMEGKARVVDGSVALGTFNLVGLAAVDLAEEKAQRQADTAVRVALRALLRSQSSWQSQMCLGSSQTELGQGGVVGLGVTGC